VKKAICALILSAFATPAFAQNPITASAPARTAAEARADSLRVARVDMSPAAFRSAADAQVLSQQAWQQQYDAAKTRKSSAKTKIYIGLAAGVGGVILASASAQSCVNEILTSSVPTCTGSSAMANIGWIASVAGDGVAIWGFIEYFDANGDVRGLEANRPKAPVPSIALTNHQAIQFSLGRRSTVGYKVSW